MRRPARLLPAGVDAINYYYIAFDESRSGWVDVDYLYWKRLSN